MPKQVLKLEQFHGGINSASDPRDIAPNEFSTLIDIAIDQLGKIKTSGSNVAHDAPAQSVVINPGYGLFAFSHDRTGGEDAGSSEAETGDDYLALADTDGGAEIFVYSRVGDIWSSTAPIDLGSTTGMKPTFYMMDG